jgi:glutathione S-transferase
MQLYGGLASPFVARVVLFARLKGIDLVPVMPDGGIKTPAYAALNPMQRMPVLRVDGVAIPESEVICEFLEDRNPGGGLPDDVQTRALSRTIARVLDLYVMVPGVTLFRNMNPATRDTAAIGTASGEISAGLGYLEHFLVATPFAAGATLSLADCALLPAVVILRKTVVPAFRLADPVATGKLGRWWENIADDGVAGPFRNEYEAATDAFLAATRA